jgi:signal transduction histidine kinase
MATSRKATLLNVNEALNQEELRTKVRALENFCAAVAHDLRGPIGSVSMKLEHFLSGKESKNVSLKWISMLQSAHESLERATALLQTMYDCTRAKGGEIQKSTVSLNQVVREVLTDINAARKAEIEVGILPIISGSAPLLRQLFQNIISNAITHAEAELPMLSIHARDEGENSVVVSVIDNGEGFASVPDLSMPSKHGGVGLYLAEQIAHLHGGAIRILPGEGGHVDIVLTRS